MPALATRSRQPVMSRRRIAAASSGEAATGRSMILRPSAGARARVLDAVARPGAKPWTKRAGPPERLPQEWKPLQPFFTSIFTHTAVSSHLRSALSAEGDCVAARRAGRAARRATAMGTG
jgi:hypothetical protein